MLPKKKTDPVTEALAATDNAGLQQVINKLPEDMQQKVVETIDPATKAIAADALKGMQDLERRLGRKPTFAEVTKELFGPMMKKAMGNEEVTNAATGGKAAINQPDKKKLTDGK